MKYSRNPIGMGGVIGISAIGSLVLQRPEPMIDDPSTILHILRKTTASTC